MRSIAARQRQLPERPSYSTPPRSLNTLSLDELMSVIRSKSIDSEILADEINRRYVEYDKYRLTPVEAQKIPTLVKLDYLRTSEIRNKLLGHTQIIKDLKKYSTIQYFLLLVSVGPWIYREDNLLISKINEKMQNIFKNIIDIYTTYHIPKMKYEYDFFTQLFEAAVKSFNDRNTVDFRGFDLHINRQRINDLYDLAADGRLWYKGEILSEDRIDLSRRLSDHVNAAISHIKITNYEQISASRISKYEENPLISYYKGSMAGRVFDIVSMIEYDPVIKFRTPSEFIGNMFDKFKTMFSVLVSHRYLDYFSVIDQPDNVLKMLGFLNELKFDVEDDTCIRNSAYIYYKKISKLYTFIMMHPHIDLSIKEDAKFYEYYVERDGVTEHNSTASGALSVARQILFYFLGPYKIYFPDGNQDMRFTVAKTKDERFKLLKNLPGDEIRFNVLHFFKDPAVRRIIESHGTVNNTKNDRDSYVEFLLGNIDTRSVSVRRKYIK